MLFVPSVKVKIWHFARARLEHVARSERQKINVYGTTVLVWLRSFETSVFHTIFYCDNTTSRQIRTTCAFR